MRNLERGIGEMIKKRVQYYNNENEFLFGYGVTFGYFIVQKKVHDCIFLSSEAKMLYYTILRFTYEGQKECFPSQGLLCYLLGWTKKTLIKYLNELIELGFIEIELNSQTQTYIYKIKELQHVKVIKHSELIHSIRPDSGKKILSFIERLKEYKESELFKKVNEAEDPFIYYDEVYNFFYCPEPEDKPEIESEYFQNPDLLKEVTEVASEDRMEKIENAGVEENKIISKYKSQAKQIATKINYSEIETTNLDKSVESVKKVISKNYEDKPIEKWNTRDFCKYFADKYSEKMKSDLRVNFGQFLGQMKTLMIKIKDNEKLKKMIDVFMESDVFEVKSFSSFISEKVQSILDYYMVNGVFPGWVLATHEKNERKKIEATKFKSIQIENKSEEKTDEKPKTEKKSSTSFEELMKKFESLLDEEGRIHRLRAYSEEEYQNYINQGYLPDWIIKVYELNNDEIYDEEFERLGIELRYDTFPNRSLRERRLQLARVFLTSKMKVKSEDEYRLYISSGYLPEWIKITEKKG